MTITKTNSTSVTKGKSADITPRKANPKSVLPTQTIQAVRDRLKQIDTPTAAHALAQEWGGEITQEKFQTLFHVGSDTLRKTNAELFDDLSAQIKRVRRIYKGSTVRPSVPDLDVGATDERSPEEIIRDLRDRLWRVEQQLKVQPKPPSDSQVIKSLRARVETLEALLAAQVEENLELVQQIEDLWRQLRPSDGMSP